MMYSTQEPFHCKLFYSRKNNLVLSLRARMDMEDTPN